MYSRDCGGRAKTICLNSRRLYGLYCNLYLPTCNHTCVCVWTSETVLVNLLRSPGIDSQLGGQVRQPYLSYRPARQHRLEKSIPRNRFLGSFNVYKYGICCKYTVSFQYYTRSLTIQRSLHTYDASSQRRKYGGTIMDFLGYIVSICLEIFVQKIEELSHFLLLWQKMWRRTKVHFLDWNLCANEKCVQWRKISICIHLNSRRVALTVRWRIGWREGIVGWVHRVLTPPPPSSV